MKITSIVNQPSVNNLRIQKPTQRILVVNQSGSPFNLEMISVKLSRKNAPERVVAQNNYVKEIIPFVQLGNGFNPVIAGKYGAVIEIADGQPPMAEGDEFIVDMTGLTDSTTYDVYAIGSPVVVNHLIKYSRSSVQSGQTSKDFSTDGAKMLALSGTSLQGLTFVTFSGELLQFTTTELKALDLINQDFAYLGLTDSDLPATAPLFTTDNYYLLNIENISRIIIDTDGAADCPYTTLSFQEL